MRFLFLEKHRPLPLSLLTADPPSRYGAFISYYRRNVRTRIASWEFITGSDLSIFPYRIGYYIVMTLQHYTLKGYDGHYEIVGMKTFFRIINRTFSLESF